MFALVSRMTVNAIIEAVIGGIILLVMVWMIRRLRTGLEDWLVHIAARAEDVQHDVASVSKRVAANGMDTDNVGDTSKRNEMILGVLARVLHATVDKSRLDPLLAKDFETIITDGKLG